MKFTIIHKLASYLLVLSSFAALALSGELDPLAEITFILALPISWFFKPKKERASWSTWLWNGATIAVSIYVTIDIISGGPLLIGAINLLLFLTANKLFNRNTSKDYIHLYVLSFLILIGAAAINTDLSFAILFIFYLIFATWSLTLLHLRRQMEENYLLRHSADAAHSTRVDRERIFRSRRIVGGRFLLATSGLALVIFILTGAIFMIFPRVGFGLFYGRSHLGLSMAGFSKEIVLGKFGRIKDNKTVVMRIEFPSLKSKPKEPFYWRGITFDHYDGIRWRKLHSGSIPLSREKKSGRFLVNKAANLDQAFQQLIYLEPMADTNTLFTTGKVEAIELPGRPKWLPSSRRDLRIDAYGDFSYYARHNIAFRYLVHSKMDQPTVSLLEKATPVLNYKLARYIQTPDYSLNTYRLAYKIVRGAKNRYEQVQAVRKYLQKNYRYTLNRKSAGDQPPLEDFLFTNREGHCEYFSTAMVILLRILKIPARSVNGFHGGHWNQIGKYLVIRQGDAHSWMEVHFGQYGWIPFDPTPPNTNSRSTERGAFAWFDEFFDSLRLKWHKWIVEYNLTKQFEIFRRIGQWFKSLFSGGVSGFFKRLKNFLFSPSGIILLILLAALITMLILRRRRRGGGQRHAPPRLALRITSFYLKMLELLRRHGYEKTPAQTPREFVKWMEDKGLTGAQAATRITELYNRIRFGGEELNREKQQLLRTYLKELKENLKPK